MFLQCNRDIVLSHPVYSTKNLYNETSIGQCIPKFLLKLYVSMGNESQKNIFVCTPLQCLNFEKIFVIQELL